MPLVTFAVVLAGNEAAPSSYLAQEDWISHGGTEVSEDFTLLSQKSGCRFIHFTYAYNVFTKFIWHSCPACYRVHIQGPVSFQHPLASFAARGTLGLKRPVLRNLGYLLPRADQVLKAENWAKRCFNTETRSSWLPRICSRKRDHRENSRRNAGSTEAGIAGGMEETGSAI